MKKRNLVVASILAMAVLAGCTEAAPEVQEAAMTEETPSVETEAVEEAAAEETAAEEATTEEATAEETVAEEATAEEVVAEDAEATEEVALYDNTEYATEQIEAAMQALIEEEFGENVEECKVTVEKIYDSEAMADADFLAELNITENDAAFEVSCELKPAEGADVDAMLIPNGEFDEESGWVKDWFRLGVLRAEGEGFVVTDLGTGW